MAPRWFRLLLVCGLAFANTIDNGRCYPDPDGTCATSPCKDSRNAVCVAQKCRCKPGQTLDGESCVGDPAKPCEKKDEGVQIELVSVKLLGKQQDTLTSYDEIAAKVDNGECSLQTDHVYINDESRRSSDFWGQVALPRSGDSGIKVTLVEIDTFSDDHSNDTFVVEKEMLDFIDEQLTNCNSKRMEFDYTYKIKSGLLNDLKTFMPEGYDLLTNLASTVASNLCVSPMDLIPGGKAVSAVGRTALQKGLKKGMKQAAKKVKDKVKKEVKKEVKGQAQAAVDGVKTEVIDMGKDAAGLNTTGSGTKGEPAPFSPEGAKAIVKAGICEHSGIDCGEIASGLDTMLKVMDFMTVCLDDVVDVLGSSLLETGEASYMVKIIATRPCCRAPTCASSADGLPKCEDGDTQDAALDEQCGSKCRDEETDFSLRLLPQPVLQVLLLVLLLSMSF